jgi:hypothetical protein
MNDMSVEEVLKLLKERSIPDELIQIFKNHKIDGDSVLNLEENEIIEMFPKIGSRKKIRKFVNKFKNDYNNIKNIIEIKEENDEVQIIGENNRKRKNLEELESNKKIKEEKPNVINLNKNKIIEIKKEVVKEMENEELILPIKYITPIKNRVINSPYSNINSKLKSELTPIKKNSSMKSNFNISTCIESFKKN